MLIERLGSRLSSLTKIIIAGIRRRCVTRRRRKPLTSRCHTEALERRDLLSWGSVPPTTMSAWSRVFSQSVTLNDRGDATLTGAITSGEVDRYRFVAPTGGTYTIRATTPNSSLDTVAAIYNGTDGVIRGYNDDAPGMGTDSKFSVNLVAGASYVVGVTNWGSSSRGSYTLSIDGPVRYNPNLYIDFDGEVIFRQTLLAYSNGEWLPGHLEAFDRFSNGVSVAEFLPGRVDREYVIGRVLAHVRQNLSDFGVQVHRIPRNGGVIAGTGATTVLVGANTEYGDLDGVPGIAASVDTNNDNGTDVALVSGYSWWASDPAETIARRIATIIVHEAGHTWGLAHLAPWAQGLPEFMNANLDAQNSFLNIWLPNEAGVWQNSYFTLRQMFPRIGSIQQSITGFGLAPSSVIGATQFAPSSQTTMLPSLPGARHIASSAVASSAPLAGHSSLVTQTGRVALLQRSEIRPATIRADSRETDWAVPSDPSPESVPSMLIGTDRTAATLTDRIFSALHPSILWNA